MAKTFDIYMNREDIVRETEKAYGFEYDCEGWAKILWLPKSQLTIEDVEDDGESVMWREGDIVVSMPMWLARNNRYFKGTLIQEVWAG